MRYPILPDPTSYPAILSFPFLIPLECRFISIDKTSHFISSSIRKLLKSRRYKADFGRRHVIDFQFSCALYFERRTPSDGANNAAGYNYFAGFVQGQISLDIVLEQSITKQRSFVRTNREIVLLLGKYKRKVRVRIRVSVRSG